MRKQNNKPILVFELVKEHNTETNITQWKVGKVERKIKQMNTVQPISHTALNQNREHYNPLTEEQKQHNREEAHSKIFQIVLEKILSDGGLTNASN